MRFDAVKIVVWAIVVVGSWAMLFLFVWVIVELVRAVWP
jgi:hypothetical protein